MTRTAVVTILKELKPYNSTYASVARRFGVSVTQVINLFDKYIRVKRKKFPRILLINEFFFSRKTKYKYPTILMNFENNVIIDVIKYINDQLNNTRIRVMRKYYNDKTPLEYRLLKHRYKLLLKNEENLDIEIYKKDNILGYTTTQHGVVHQMLLIDKEIEKHIN